MGHTSEHIHLIYSTQGSIRYPTCTIGFFYLFLYSRVQWHIPHNRDFSTGPGSKESNVQVQMSVLIRLSPGSLPFRVQGFSKAQGMWVHGLPTTLVLYL